MSDLTLPAGAWPVADESWPTATDPVGIVTAEANPQLLLALASAYAGAQSTLMARAQYLTRERWIRLRPVDDVGLRQWMAQWDALLAAVSGQQTRLTESWIRMSLQQFGVPLPALEAVDDSDDRARQVEAWLDGEYADVDADLHREAEALLGRLRDNRASMADLARADRLPWLHTPVISGRTALAADLPLSEVEPSLDVLVDTSMRTNEGDVLEHINWPRFKNGKALMAKRVPEPGACGWCRVIATRLYALSVMRRSGSWHAHCVLPGQVVSGDVRILAATRRRYAGEVVTIVTGSNQLTVTENHPILTARGWVFAKGVLPGDEVIERPFGQLVVGSGPHEQQMQGRIEDVFGAVAVAGSVTMPSTPEDFHGDGADDEIDVVHLHPPLRDITDPPFIHPHRELLVVGRSGVDSSPLTPLSGLDGSALRLGLPPHGSMRSLRQSETLLRGHAGHALEHRLAPTARLHSLAQQVGADRVARHHESPGEREFGFTSDVSGDGVALFEGFEVEARALAVAVGTRHYEGPVYNLETDKGWFAVSNIVTHNCRCQLVLATEAEVRAYADALGEDANYYRAAARLGLWDGPTEPGSYTDVINERATTTTNGAPE